MVTVSEFAAILISSAVAGFAGGCACAVFLGGIVRKEVDRWISDQEAKLILKDLDDD